MNNKASAGVAFGVATAVMNISPSAEATIVDLTIVPSSVGFQTITSNAVNVNLGSGIFSFSQWNDVVGQTLFGADGSMGLVAAGSSVNAGQFGGATAIGFSASFNGTTFIGFTTAGGNAGWIEINFDNTTDEINYLGAAYEDSGGPIVAGESAAVVPEPATLGLLGLGLLAAGAAGKRRKAPKHEQLS